MSVSSKIRTSIQKASWVRKMFEEGALRKEKYGPENVYDFSLGNPNLEPPKKFGEILSKLATNNASGMHRYMPNAGFVKTREAVAHYFNATDVKPIRIFVTQGCGGQQLAMALDGIAPGDAVHEAGGFQFVMQRRLLERAQPVEVDFSDSGFRISSSLELDSGCRTCGTAGSCCGSQEH